MHSLRGIGQADLPDNPNHNRGYDDRDCHHNGGEKIVRGSDLVIVPRQHGRHHTKIASIDDEANVRPVTKSAERKPSEREYVKSADRHSSLA